MKARIPHSKTFEGYYVIAIKLISMLQTIRTRKISCIYTLLNSLTILSIIRLF